MAGIKLRVLGALVALTAGSVVGFFPADASLEDQAVPHRAVTPEDDEGWKNSDTHAYEHCGDRSTGSESFVPGPPSPPDGDGSLQMQVVDGSHYWARRQSRYDGLLLSELQHLSYWTYVSQAGLNVGGAPSQGAVEGAAPDIRIYLDLTNDGVADEFLLYQAVYNTDHNGEDVKLRAWQRWDVAGGQLTRNGDDGDFPGKFTTKDEYAVLRAATPPRIAGIVVMHGCIAQTSAAGSTANVDSIRVAFGKDPATAAFYSDEVYDFEPNPNADEDDRSSFKFRDAPYNAFEGTPRTITVERTGSVGTATVDVVSRDAAATAGQDYTAVNRRLVFANGETSKTFEIAIIDDTTPEPAEDFLLELRNPQNGATISQPNPTTVTIDENDGAGGGTTGGTTGSTTGGTTGTTGTTGSTTGGTTQPTMKLSSATYSVGESSSSVSITVTRSSSSGTASATYSTANSTATAGSDYTAASGTVSFAAGETSKTVTVPILNDTVAESDETFTFQLSNPSGAQLASPSTATVTITDDDGERVTRLAGDSRYHSAVTASKSSYPTDGSAAAVVLTTGENFPDALPGTALAVAKNGPLLLTSGAGLNQETEDEIKRVLPSGKTVFVMGGENAVGAGVQSRLQTLGYTVVRYSGNDRYETAAKVADTGLGNPTTVILTTGLNFPDALAAGTAAAKAGASVLLTAGSTMPQATRDYLAAHPPSKKYAVGGPSAEADPSATPVVGDDRFETARKVAETFFTSPTVAGIASGLVFPDALAGGAHAAKRGGPLLLTQSDKLTETTRVYLASNKASIDAAFIYGGVGAVAGTVDNEVKTAITD